MTRLMMSVAMILVASVIVACAPTTPTVQTPTTIPTAATSVPTANARATEAVIIAHVFATLTASAPTAAPVAVATPTPVRRVTTAPAQPKAAVKVPTATAPAAPKATTDPYLEQIGSGMGGILVVSYIGNREVTFTIADKVYSVPPNGKTLIVIAPGRYNFSLAVIGAPEGNKSGTIEVPSGTYTKYSAIMPD